MTGKIKLVHSGGNAVSIAVPTSNPSSSEVEFKLPGSDGSANQVLKTDGSGNLSFGADAGGKFASYAVIADQKTSGTQSGNFVSGDWRTRDLNTEITDADGIVSISSNQFTLQAGTYLIKWVCPVYGRGYHQSRLRNITDGSSSGGYGTSVYSDYNSNVQNASIGAQRVTISGAKVYELQHRCNNSTTNNDGFGTRVGNEFSTDYEMYAMCEIFKES